MRSFRPYQPDQALLLPPLLRDWLPEGHLAHFVSDVVDVLDLSPILGLYAQQEGRGQPPYHPRLMVKLLVYGYCMGVVSSRKIERATWEDLPFRVLATDQHPDHDSIAAFRQRHLAALAGLFLAVLQLCEKAGLVQLGQVAVDGTKVKANASKHKAMSYGRMQEKEEQLKAEIAALMERAAAADQREDAEEREAGGRGGDSLPEELRRRESRLAQIAKAKAELEAEAREQAEQEAAGVRERLAERERQAQETGKKPRGRAPVVPDPERAKPEPTAQKNFTDPESRIMKDGASGGFVQAYNAQVVVDGTAQVIVAAAVTQQAGDQQQLVPMLTKTKENLGRLPEQGTADTGYFSAAAVSDPALAGMALYVPPKRPSAKGAGSGTAATELPPGEATAAQRMRARLATPEGKAIYARRKAIVEPVFGQMKEERGFRRFSFRGLVQVTAEWLVMCLTHNLLKLFRSGWRRTVLAAA